MVAFPWRVIDDDSRNGTGNWWEAWGRGLECAFSWGFWEFGRCCSSVGHLIYQLMLVWPLSFWARKPLMININFQIPAYTPQLLRILMMRWQNLKWSCFLTIIYFSSQLCRKWEKSTFYGPCACPSFQSNEWPHPLPCVGSAVRDCLAFASHLNAMKVQQNTSFSRMLQTES